MRSKIFAHIALLLLPFVGQAQDTPPHFMGDHLYFGPAYFENARDSAEFTFFRTGLRRLDPTLPTDTTTAQYRMVWQENQHGGFWMVSRGDGSLLRHTGNHMFDPSMSYPFRTANGRRGVVVTHDIPCGLIRRTTWYYVED